MPHHCKSECGSCNRTKKCFRGYCFEGCQGRQAAVLFPDSSNPNADLFLISQGTGAIARSYNDAGCRGDNATDWQSLRVDPSQVASGVASTLSGGAYNTASGGFSTVGGGNFNGAQGFVSTIAGGATQVASGDYTTIGGGASNSATELNATVAGGAFNTASGLASTVGGGSGNGAQGEATTVGGGQDNIADSDGSTISGGAFSNATGTFSTISGGLASLASGNYSTIAGGALSAVTGDFSTVGGGFGNSVTEFLGTIAGGGLNQVFAGTGTIGGGDGNVINESARFGTIPGGQGLILNVPASTAVGQFNLPEEDLIFMVGSGNDENNRKNAFAVTSGGDIRIGGAILSDAPVTIAQYFESSNGKSIPTGIPVALDPNGKIYPAKKKDEAFGVVTSKATYVGNAAEKEWHGKWSSDFETLKEEVRVPIVTTKDVQYTEDRLDYTVDPPVAHRVKLTKTIEVPETVTVTIKNEKGEEIGQRTIVKTKSVTREIQHRKLSPKFDPTKKYVPRSQRPEWNLVALMGPVELLKGKSSHSRWVTIKEGKDKDVVVLR